MKHIQLIVAFATALQLVPLNSTAAQLQLDNFEGPSVSIATDLGPNRIAQTTQNGLDQSAAFFGNRQISAWYAGEGGHAAAEVLGMNGGEFRFDLAPSLAPRSTSSVTLQWGDAFDAGLNYSLNDQLGVTPTLAMEFLRLDLSRAPLSIQVLAIDRVSANEAESEIIGNVQLEAGFTTPSLVLIPLQATASDLIDEINIRFSVGPGRQATGAIANVQLVPEPNTSLLACLGLLIGSWKRRRPSAAMTQPNAYRGITNG